MARPESRAQLMSYFGAKQKNSLWSWCGINEKEKSIYFSIWTDHYDKFEKKDRKYYTIQEPHWTKSDKPGPRTSAIADHNIFIEKVLNDGYKAFGYFIVAKDKNAVPRTIKEARTSFVFSLELERLETGEVIAYPLERIEID